MTTYVFEVGTITPGAGTADGSTLTNNTFMAIVGANTTQVNFVEEVYMGGQAASTAVLIMLLGRDSTIGSTPTTLVTPNTQGPGNPSSAAATASAFIAATGNPQRSNSITNAKKNFTFNAFGGIVRANYANTQDRFGILGNAAAAPGGEMSLSSFTGSGAGAAIGAHIIYETM